MKKSAKRSASSLALKCDKRKVNWNHFQIKMGKIRTENAQTSDGSGSVYVVYWGGGGGEGGG